MNFREETVCICEAFRAVHSTGIPTMEHLLETIRNILKEKEYGRQTQHGIILHALRIYLVTLAEEEHRKHQEKHTLHPALISDRHTTEEIFGIFIRAAKSTPGLRRQLEKIKDLVINPKAREEFMDSILIKKERRTPEKNIGHYEMSA